MVVLVLGYALAFPTGIPNKVLQQFLEKFCCRLFLPHISWQIQTFFFLAKADGKGNYVRKATGFAYYSMVQNRQ